MVIPVFLVTVILPYCQLIYIIFSTDYSKIVQHSRISIEMLNPLKVGGSDQR